MLGLADGLQGSSRTGSTAKRQCARVRSSELAQYKTFASPFAKVFLGAIFTYQVIYWTWLKLEMDESKLEKNQEVAALEKKARELTNVQK
ncbi:uncharacterized protein AFUA_8G04280 [Aspergillus fumigatus Af293]|uniref:Uncharacterized protein n=2 Tax=Aspergillus fumigatus TaxID=746128 RepID=Q4WCI7_ASPFU|nr:conserved hypothetical protein [Aspergillus fumigatus Af293]EAL85197.1 conserved hypothetical protein [Aspergillus fumigatus Af293]EDP48878.1 conserved hypothetical protein [Aspergillus fumigatus A1163]